MRRLSYQSGPNSWKYLIVFIGIFVSSTSLAEPYQDTKNRYTLEIPEGWTLAPIFGRPDSARFQRKLRNSKQPAWLKLTVMTADSRDLKSARTAYHRRELAPDSWSVKTKGSKAYRSSGLKRVLTRKAGQTSGKARVLHHCFSEVEGFWVSFELYTPSERNYPSLFREVRNIVDSLNFAQVREVRPSADKTTAQSHREVIGDWFRPPNERLTLSSDGQFTIQSDGKTKKGRFEISNGSLLLKREKVTRFLVNMTDDSDALVLKAEKSGKVLRYTRRASGRRSLIGRWTRKTKTFQKTLTFHENGYFEYGRMRGHWMAEGREFVLVSPNGSKLSYQFRFNEGFLIVSGGDFPQDVYFQKKRGS